MNRIARAGLFIALLGFGLGAHAQAQDPKVAVAAARPAARATDVASVDAIMAALYEVVSGPAGKVRDWDRLRSFSRLTARWERSAPSPAAGSAIAP